MSLVRLKWPRRNGQVFDLSKLRFEVTEHRVLKTPCTCGQVARGEFLPHVRAHVQYGPWVMVALVHLNQHHKLPVQGTVDLIEDFFQLPISEAMVFTRKRCTLSEGSER